MHIPLNLTITCARSNENNIRGFLTPNKLIHVGDIYDTPTTDANKVILHVSGVVFDDADIPLIRDGLRHYGDVIVNRGRVKTLTLSTLLSGLVVAGIVAVALFGHSLNGEFYKEVFERHNTAIIFQTLFVIGFSAVGGFILEILIVYKERRATLHH